MLTRLWEGLGRALDCRGGDGALQALWEASVDQDVGKYFNILPTGKLDISLASQLPYESCSFLTILNQNEAGNKYNYKTENVFYTPPSSRGIKASFPLVKKWNVELCLDFVYLLHSPQRVNRPPPG